MGSTEDPRTSPKRPKDPYVFTSKKVYSATDLDYLRTTVTCKSVTDNVKLSIMEEAVAPCPEIAMTIHGQTNKALLDSGSEVSLMNQSYFVKSVQPKIPPPIPGRENAHLFFHLKGVEDGRVPLSDYFTTDVEIGGMTIPNIGILVKQDNIDLVDSKGQISKCPAILGCNLFRRGVEEFSRIFGEDALKLFECPRAIDPLFFSTLCVFFYAERQRVLDEAKAKVQENTQNIRGVGANYVDHPQTGQQESSPKKEHKESIFSKKNRKIPGNDLGGYVGRVMVGDRHRPTCIPAHSSKVVVGKSQGSLGRGTFMVEETDEGNLPLGVGINRTFVSPSKNGFVSVILINNNDHNVWLRQPLYAGDLWECDLEDWEYEPVLKRESETNKIEIHLQKVPPEHLRADIKAQAAEEKGQEGGSQDEHDAEPKDQEKEEEVKPEFGPRPDTDSPDFDFDKEVDRLPFPLNMGTAPLTLEQKKRFINLIYDSKEVFSLYDGDLGHCDKLKHSIPTTTDRPVYLPHRQIPVQLQLVVIVRKKTGEIRLCIDFRKLNAISIRDSFPLPRIEEALQAVQAAMWFTSFDLAQGYLQMAMEEADIPKTAFRAGSTGFYEFLRMPFGLTNAGASFCRLMEMCIGDQQYVTLLFYLDDICVFAENADDMLDRVELVFQRLKSFNLKVKPKKSFYFQDEVNFLGHILSAKGVSPNPEKVEKVKNWPIPTNPKEVHSFVGLASYYRRFIPNFAKWAGPLQALIIPHSTTVKLRRGEIKKKDIPEFNWTEECQEGFDKLKEALTTAPVLSYPDYTKPFTLETDASLRGIGAVLSQIDQDGDYRVIAYAS